MFLINLNTHIEYNGDNKAVKNAIGILERDIKKCFDAEEYKKNEILLREDDRLADEEFVIKVSGKIVIYAKDELGFVYGLLYISEKFLGIKPFWFWMDQKIEKRKFAEVEEKEYHSVKPIIKYRGWFVNDEVLIMKWNIDGDPVEPWKMVFEALLRCGGNMVIPGTDKNSKRYRQTASDMGLWITHHHAEPLGAEMFTREYPDMEPNYAETPKLFHKLWEDAIKEQKDMKVVWCLGFRGQGDCPFWSHDSSGRFNTPEKRGALISSVIELQRQMVKKYVKNPVFCTNLYGEIMELYDEGLIDFADDIIKISADNGYGKMVTRRRDNHVVRISSMPKDKIKHGGIYYHVSFYDLQAANHITMLPNSAEFVNNELNAVVEKNMTDYWIINCSNVRPHTYFLDAVRRKWYGEEINDDTQSKNFTDIYYNGNEAAAEAYRDYHKAMIAYGKEEDEHAGEQFYTENIRLLVHSIFNERADGTPGLRWLIGMHPLNEQINMFSEYCRKNFSNIKKYYERCKEISETLGKDDKQLFETTIMLQAGIHYHCTQGVINFADGYNKYAAGDKLGAFITLGDAAKEFYTANDLMRGSEHGVWRGFYFNDCFADVKHSGYMIEKLMGYVREKGDNARHDKWYREAVYAPRDRKVLTLLVDDNHMKDWELYEAFKMKKGE